MPIPGFASCRNWKLITWLHHVSCVCQTAMAMSSNDLAICDLCGSPAILPSKPARLRAYVHGEPSWGQQVSERMSRFDMIWPFLHNVQTLEIFGHSGKEVQHLPPLQWFCFGRTMNHCEADRCSNMMTLHPVSIMKCCGATYIYISYIILTKSKRPE